MTMYANNAQPPRTMTRHEQLLLLRTTGQRFDGYRDHVLLSLALATGMREHELVALNIGDVLADDGKARRRVQLRVFKRSHEDARGQEVVLSPTIQAKLEKFLRWKRQQDESTTADAPLFVSRNGNRLSVPARSPARADPSPILAVSAHDGIPRFRAARVSRRGPQSPADPARPRAPASTGTAAVRRSSPPARSALAAAHPGATPSG